MIKVDSTRTSPQSAAASSDVKKPMFPTSASVLAQANGGSVPGAKADSAPVAVKAPRVAAAAKPVAVKARPAVAKPAVAKPTTIKPAAAKPAAAKPAAAKTTAAKTTAAKRAVAGTAAPVQAAPMQAAPKLPVKARAAVVIPVDPDSRGKAHKPKLVRDSFTMPEQEYAMLGQVKKACLKAGFEIRKSELLRIGVALISQIDLATLQAVLMALPKLKTGRPKKS